MLAVVVTAITIGSTTGVKQSEAQAEVLRNPYGVENNLRLAEMLLASRQFEKAERVLEYALGLPYNFAQLTQINELKETLVKTDPIQIKQQITAWDKILENEPNYRDAYLTVTLLYLKLNNKSKAREYLQKAVEIDPNYQAALDLEKFTLF